MFLLSVNVLNRFTVLIVFILNALVAQVRGQPNIVIILIDTLSVHPRIPVGKATPNHKLHSTGPLKGHG